MIDPARQELAGSVLEWGRVLQLVAEQARSAMGVELCRALPLEHDLTAAQARADETGEMVALAERGESFPSLAFPDMRQALGRLVKGAPLEAHELRDLSIVLGLAIDAEWFLDRHHIRTHALRSVTASLQATAEFKPLKQAIDQAIDTEGSIKESATPELRRLTHHAHDLKQQMRHRLAVILESRRYADVLQEHYFAQREGRYVVPVKSEMRSKVPGIVHDVSASGATVFLEPRELVDLNNSIKYAELEVDREARRIMRELSASAAEHEPAIAACMACLAQLDCIAAKAGFSQLVRGRAVTLNGQGRIILKQARHPLLVMAREHVVPNDIVMDERTSVLVISGPNTGGKTVNLKMVGLFALMVRAGLQLPCAVDSEMAVFPEVFADIGDPQDLTKDLSSFSAHMTQMINLLHHAMSERELAENQEHASLVLLDELVTSTDPTEGAALAEALLLELAKQGMKVIVTTHYNALKVLAQQTPGFLNASLEFDVGTLSPTYRLQMGLPGGSSAIEIAGRLGMEERILEHARSLLRREDQMLERVLSDLQDKQRRLDQDRTLIEELRAQAETSAREAREVSERLGQSEREERKKIKKKLSDEILKARAAVQAVLDELKRERTLIKAKEAKSKLAEIDSAARESVAPAQEHVPLDELTTGASVEVVGLGSIGTLLEAPQGKKRVRIRVGEKEMSVLVSQLAGLPDQPGSGDATHGKAASAPGAGGLGGVLGRITPTGQDRDREGATVLDLRGKTAEEALDATVAALDEAVLNGQPWLRLIHGHGTGRLKTVLRQYLRDSPYVSEFRAGERAEGGDGVTVVKLKE